MFEVYLWHKNELWNFSQTEGHWLVKYVRQTQTAFINILF